MCLIAAACGDSAAEAGNYSSDTEGYGSGVSPSGTSAASSTSEGNEPPPEDEMEADFRVPRASGRFVYSSSETTHSVAVIDTASLAIDVIGVGQGPTVVTPLDEANPDPDRGAVAVLCQGSSELAVLRTDASVATSVALYPVTPGANNLAVAPGGRYVFVYHDINGPETLGPGSDQELTVVDTDAAADGTFEMTVGAHPRDIAFSANGQRAFVITDDGISVVPITALGTFGKPELVPVIADPGIDPATLEIQVASNQDAALARVDGEPWLVVTDLTSYEQTLVELPGIPTDLDLADDQSFALLTLPSTGPAGSAVVELPLPFNQGNGFETVEIKGEYVGLAELAPSGDTALLYTTQNPYGDAPAGDPGLGQHATLRPRTPYVAATTGTTGDATTGDATTGDATTGDLTTGDNTTTTTGDDTGGPEPPDVDPRQRITIARRDGPSWQFVTLFVEVPVTAAGVSPDNLSALLLHDVDSGGPSGAPWSYSLVDLSQEFPVKKRQTVEAPPEPILLTPDGARAAVLLRDDNAGVQRVDLVNLRSFIVDSLQLGSPPEGAGYVDATAKIYVSQAHPTGRITFIDTNGAVQTVTGFELNDSVKD